MFPIFGLEQLGVFMLPHLYTVLFWDRRVATFASKTRTSSSGLWLWIPMDSLAQRPPFPRALGSYSPSTATDPGLVQRRLGPERGAFFVPAHPAELWPRP